MKRQKNKGNYGGKTLWKIASRPCSPPATHQSVTLKRQSPPRGGATTKQWPGPIPPTGSVAPNGPFLGVALGILIRGRGGPPGEGLELPGLAAHGALGVRRVLQHPLLDAVHVERRRPPRRRQWHKPIPPSPPSKIKCPIKMFGPKFIYREVRAGGIGVYFFGSDKQAR